VPPGHLHLAHRSILRGAPDRGLRPRSRPRRPCRRGTPSRPAAPGARPAAPPAPAGPGPRSPPPPQWSYGGVPELGELLQDGGVAQRPGEADDLVAALVAGHLDRPAQAAARL